MIHYHGGPCSGAADLAVRFYRGRHIMVSYAYPDHMPAVAEVAKTFALDNGAFTTWRSGKEFDYEGYSAWVEVWAQHPGFAWCLIPDVVEASEAENWKVAKRWITTFPHYRTPSVPVWHLHDSMDYLCWLASNFPVVAFGSSGQWATPGTDGWWDRIGEAMTYITDSNGRPQCKIHGLRMLNRDIFTRIPFASADSTNACQNAGSVKRFGMYPAPEAWQRAAVIADRIEAENSAPVWQASEQRSLFEMMMKEQ